MREPSSDLNRPDHEPGPAVPSPVSEPGPSAPDEPAPDLDAIEAGDGPGQSPGE